MIKKKMSLLLAAVLVASGVGIAKPALAETSTKVLPKITYVAPSITMAEVGDDFSFALQSDYEGDVQYRIWAQDLKTNQWFELTNDYTEAVKGTDPFIPAGLNKLEAGSYKAVIWVKAAGETGAFSNKNGEYDSIYVRNFKIQNDGYFDGRAKMDNLGLKDTYSVDEFVTIEGEDEYKLHMFDPSAPVRAEGWTIDETYESAEETADDYAFAAPGKYLVDVWGKKADSTNKYDGWVLKVVTVEEAAVTEIPSFEVVDADSTKLPMQTLVQIALDTETPENYKVTVGEKELELRENAAGEQVFIGVVNGTLTAEEVEALVVVESLVKEEVTFEVVDADSTKLPMQTLVQIALDTETPENYTVKVGEKELELRENAAGEQVFIGVVNGTLTAEQVEALVVIE